MNKGSSIIPVNIFGLSNQAKFRLNKINEIKSYFNSEIQERKIMITWISKYIAAFDDIKTTLVVLYAASGGISIISFASVIGIPAGITNASCNLFFFDNRNNNESFEKKTKKNKKYKKHNNIVILAKSKLNNTENLISQALIDLEISREKFKTIVREKGKYRKMKKTY